MKTVKSLTAVLAGSLLTLATLGSVSAVASPVDTRVARGEEQQNPRGQEAQAPRGEEQQDPRGQETQNP